MMDDESFYLTLLSSKRVYSVQIDNVASNITNLLDRPMSIQNLNVSLCELIVSSQVYNLNEREFYVGYNNSHENAPHWLRRNFVSFGNETT